MALIRSLKGSLALGRKIKQSSADLLYLIQFHSKIKSSVVSTYLPYQRYLGSLGYLEVDLAYSGSTSN